MASSRTAGIPSAFQQSYANIKAIEDVPGLTRKKVLVYYTNVVVDQPYRINAEYEIATRFFTHAILEDGSSLRFEMKRTVSRTVGNFAGLLLITQPPPPSHLGPEEMNPGPLVKFARVLQREVTVGLLLALMEYSKLLQYSFNFETHEGFWHLCLMNLLEANQVLERESASDFIKEIDAYNTKLAAGMDSVGGAPPQGVPHIETDIATKFGTFGEKEVASIA